jgi:hypothetical protein
MSNWKQNLQNLLQMHGNYPKKQWYDNLSHWARTWSKNLQQSGYNTHVSSGYPHKVVITAKKYGIGTTSFICELQYKITDNNQPALSVKSVKDFKFGSYTNACMTAEESGEDLVMQYYIWDEFELDGGEEIFAEGFVTETIRLAFKRYLEFRSPSANGISY